MNSNPERRCLVITSGKSTRGLEDRFCGWTDPPLSSQGREAILNLRQSCSEQHVQLPVIWYVSDRRRAVETFEIMVAGLPVPVVRLSDKLREINFGIYENLTWEELPGDFQRHYEASLQRPLELRFPGGEAFSEMCERVSAAALEMLSFREDDAPLGIVGHQGSMRLWAMMAEALPPAAFFVDTPAQGAGQWLAITAKDVALWRRRYLTPDSGTASSAGLL